MLVSILARIHRPELARLLARQLAATSQSVCRPRPHGSSTKLHSILLDALHLDVHHWHVYHM